MLCKQRNGNSKKEFFKNSRIKKKILIEMKNTFRGLINRHGTAEENEIEDVPTKS